MIKDTSIQEVRDKMDIAEVVGHFITLKKNQACCPFHHERTPSFRITPARQIFKCFGCGAGGDAIGFVMQHEKFTFIEAIQWLAQFYHITLEEDQVAAQEAGEKKSARDEGLALLRWAHGKYEEVLHNLPAEASALHYMSKRGWSLERMRSWSLGLAPDDWKFLTTPCINKGKHSAGVDAGLLVSEGGRNWDFYRHRIIIPIHDHNGVLVGFGARLIPSGDEAADKKQPKYLNPKESAVYSKAKVWFALNLAYKAIKERGFAYIVEGYMDAMAMHDAGIHNTVASCGTEIDPAQVKLLKRWTSHVVLCYDGDAAGTKKQMKQVDLFLRHDCKVQVAPLPEGMDPDEYINSYGAVADAPLKEIA